MTAWRLTGRKPDLIPIELDETVKEYQWQKTLSFHLSGVQVAATTCTVFLIR